MPYELDFAQAKTVEFDIFAAGGASSIVPIMFIRDGLPSMEGTAFCVATLINGEAIFVTADHVISDLREADIPMSVLLPRTDMPVLSALGTYAVPVDQISYASEFSDVATFVVNVNRTEATAGLQLKPLPVAVSRPVDDAECVAIGYPESRGWLAFACVASAGRIFDIHPGPRDRVMAPFPGFHATADFYHGMSGGPVLDLNGYVIGIVSTGSDDIDSGETIGHAACSAAIIELKVDVTSSNGEVHEHTIAELIDMGVIETQGEVALERSESGVTLKWADSVE